MKKRTGNALWRRYAGGRNDFQTLNYNVSEQIL